MEKDHAYYTNIVEDPRYASEPSKEEFPMFESLKLTIERTLPYWNNVIVPQLKEGKKILVAAHGNSLRGIVKHLDSEFTIFNKIIFYNAFSLKNSWPINSKSDAQAALPL